MVLAPLEEGAAMVMAMGPGSVCGPGLGKLRKGRERQAPTSWPKAAALLVAAAPPLGQVSC